MVAVKKRCCCFGLRTGAIIVGWLGLILAIGIGVFAANTLLSDNYKRLKPDWIDSDFYEESIKSSAHSEIVVSVIQFIMSITLLWGTHTGCRVMFLPWLIMNLLNIIVISSVFVLCSIMLFLVDAPGVALIVFLVGGTSMGLYTYIWICILWLYRKLRNEEKMKLNRQNEEVDIIPTIAPNVIVKEKLYPPSYNTLKNY